MYYVLKVKLNKNFYIYLFLVICFVNGPMCNCVFVDYVLNLLDHAFNRKIGGIILGCTIFIIAIVVFGSIFCLNRNKLKQAGELIMIKYCHNSLCYILL